MSERALILADFFLGEPPADAAERWRRLPALEYWLSRADPEPLPRDWRHWLLTAAGARPPEGPRDSGFAALLRADERAGPEACDPTTAQRWLATPIHWVAGLDTVRLHPEGLLQLNDVEQRSLCAEFARQFGECRLQGGYGRELLLTLPPEAGSPVLPAVALPASSDPARWLGLDPAAGLLRGPLAARLQRLMTEIEMWLHDSPVNEARRARGELPVSALWLWGGAHAGVPALPPLTSSRPLPDVDSVLRACWSLPTPVDRPAGQFLIVHAAGSAAAVRLDDVEARHVAPWLADWRRRRVDIVRLVANDRCWTLQSRHRWRRWRRTRPWWQAVAAC